MMARVIRGMLIVAVAGMIFVWPFFYYRSVYAHSKRLRVVDPGRVYRSGQMTVAGFTDAVQRLGLKTIINVQDDYPDPDIRQTYLNSRTIKESALCRQLGVRYVFIPPDLVLRRQEDQHRPAAADQLLELLRDESVYPVLLHCKAGLHRTGVLSAVYRMEYQGWTNGEAYRELKALGFGDAACTVANDYVRQYVLAYRRSPPRRTAGAQKGE